MTQKTKTDLTPYIVNVQGKDFITFPGLLAEAHAQGLKSIITELVIPDLKTPVVKAIVTLEGSKTFSGYGDATEGNVAPKVAKALLRMAETRAVARALRFACNIDMAALEEIDSEDSVMSNKPVQAPKSFSRTTTKTEGNSTTTVTATISEAAPPVNDTSAVTEKFNKPVEPPKTKQLSFGTKPTLQKPEPKFQ